MSKSINNYRGRHLGWKQKKAMKERPERKGISPINMMWMNYIAKSRAFNKTRNYFRAMLDVKGKKALTGAKRQKVLDKFFSVAYS